MQLERSRQNQRSKILHSLLCKFLYCFSGYAKKLCTLLLVFVAEFEVLALWERHPLLGNLARNVLLNPCLVFAAQKLHNKTNL